MGGATVSKEMAKEEEEAIVSSKQLLPLKMLARLS